MSHLDVPTPLAGSDLDALEAWLAPQERFERMREETFLRAGRALCDLSYANPKDGPPPAAIEAMRGALAQERVDLQYTPYGGATVPRRLIAERLSSQIGLGLGLGRGLVRYRWRDVVLTPGAMSALNVVLRALEPGGEVIVVTPCWLDVPLYLANLGIAARFVPVLAQTNRLDIAGITRALSDRTRAVLLSQPANPTGVVYSADELHALADALAHAPRPVGAQRGPIIISDECHRDFVFDPATWSSPAQHWDDTVVVYSFGKRLFMQGQRIGYAAVSPRMKDGAAFAKRLERACRALGFCTPTAHMQQSLPRLLDVEPPTGEIARLSAWYADALQSIGYQVTAAQATFFLYPRAPIEDDERFAEALARAGVLVMPSAVFGARGSFRICLTAGEDALRRALPILRDVRTHLLET